jgi:L-alanine-DL-glutamate epimerase-like enolase superfamily enzyme
MIKHVEAIPLEYPEPNDLGAIRYLCLVKVVSDEGVVGWGETWTRFREATAATCRIVEGLSEFVIGSDPVKSTSLWRTLTQHSYWYGNGGIASMAISAIDIAVWDLKARLVGRSVIDLLGGAAHERVAAIACAHPPDTEDLQAIAAEAAEWVSNGLRGYKFGMTREGRAGFGRDHGRDASFVKMLREMMGEEADIMVDVRAAFQWDVATAVRRVKAFEESGIRWIEEPLNAADIGGYRTLRDKTATLIAFGEREWTVTGYDRLLRTGVVDVVGVDPGRIGGITGTLKVIELIEREERWFNAHAWSGAVLSAASLALTAVTPRSLVFEVKPLRNPMQHELVAQPLEPTDGWMVPSSGPGLGIDVVLEAVDHYRADS